MKRYLYFLLLLALQSCIEPFSPPEITQAQVFLVVDGSLNTSPGAISQVRLSRTQNIYDEGNAPVETRAFLTVESEQGGRYFFQESATPGLYELPPNAYSPTDRYRLRIKTRAGAEYLSAYVPMTQTPPIDSVSYRISDDRTQLRILLNTKDPSNNTRFYRWSFEETWQYRASLYSGYVVGGNDMCPAPRISTPAGAMPIPSTIVLGSTIKLSQDIVRDQTITLVPASSGKLRDGTAFW